jgi:hypothetical protein
MNKYREYLPYAWMFGIDAHLWESYLTGLEVSETWSEKESSHFEPTTGDREPGPDLETTGRFYLWLALALTIMLGGTALLSIMAML